MPADRCDRSIVQMVRDVKSDCDSSRDLMYRWIDGRMDGRMDGRSISVDVYIYAHRHTYI
jgi:hypothetical protein